MHKLPAKIIALLLTLCLILSGCSYIRDYFSMLGSYLSGQPHFSDMEYTHPDIADFRQALTDCQAAAETETDLDKLIEQILLFNTVYDEYATARALSMIHYCADMTDPYWEEEYNHCQQLSTEIMAGIDHLYRALAKSTLRPQLEDEAYFGADFFADYEGQSLFDDHFISLLQQETELINQYYAIYAEAGELEPASQGFDQLYGPRMAQLMVELVLLRQQIGAYAGYERYDAFAYDFYYGRDFSPEQTTAYLSDIRAELTPLYRQLAATGDLGIRLNSCDEASTYAYVSATADAMGGMVADAFEAMEALELYDISYGENKYNASFEVYISGYYLPYVFLNPTQTERDKLSFAHEFGHYCSDYHSYGSVASIDVAEIFSQGMEYLSLCYGPADENLQKLKMLDCLCVYVEQAAMASFEQQLYALPTAQVNADTISQLYSQTCQNFGVDPGYSYTYITHFYTNPLYVISYVVSNDAALQIYQLELAQEGAGLACYNQNLIPWQAELLAFLENAALESPFATGRLQAVRQTLERALLS